MKPLSKASHTNTAIHVTQHMSDCMTMVEAYKSEWFSTDFVPISKIFSDLLIVYRRPETHPKVA
jgi:hypothetical protein